jgi:anti-sigma-K factor RskA
MIIVALHTGGSIAAAAACLAIVFTRPAPPPVPGGPILIATLATAAGAPLFVATADRSNAGVAVVPIGAVEGYGRYAELWILRAGGKSAPVGMIRGQRPHSLSVAGTRASDVFAVSLEPESGAATGAPTGPVIATGVLRAI